MNDNIVQCNNIIIHEFVLYKQILLSKETTIEVTIRSANQSIYAKFKGFYNIHSGIPS